MLVLGIASLIISLVMFVTAESALSMILLVLSIIMNVIGITLLGHVPSKKKK